MAAPRANKKGHGLALLVKGHEQEGSSLFENKIENQGAEAANQEWLSVSEAAEYLRISEGSLRNLTSNGKIPFYKLGRRVRYLKAELKALLLSNRKGVLYGN